MIDTAQLGDVAEFVRGVSFKPDDVMPIGTPDSIACMRTKNVQNQIDLSDVWAIPKRLVPNPKQLLREGDLLVSTANSWNLVGKACWVPQLPWPSTLGGFISGLRANAERVDSRYLYYWFTSTRMQAEIRACGRQTTNISNLDLNRCLRLLLPLPPILEQRRIAAILDQADALREKRVDADRRLDHLPTSVFFRLFGDPSTNPEKLKVAALGDYLRFTTSGSRGWAQFYSSSGARFIRSLDVRMNYISDSDAAYVTPPDNAEARRTKVQAGDVLLTITGSRIGRVAPVSDNIGEATGVRLKFRGVILTH